MDIEATALILFGGTGDLSKRYLIPSLYYLHRSGQLPEGFQVIAVGRRNYDEETYHEFLRSSFQELYPDNFGEASWQRFIKKVAYFRGDIRDPECYHFLRDYMTEFDEKMGICTHKIFYLAVSPSHFSNVITGIKHSKLQEMCMEEHEANVVIEKPFGKDLSSFRELNNQVLEVFSEDHVYRMDHYLGKETIKNVLFFRSANPLMFPDWNSAQIDRIDFKIFETLGVGSRAEYYDEYGQLRDMFQSHMLQLMSLFLIDLPESLEIEEINQLQADAIKSIKINDIDKDVVRGQYINGVVAGKEVVAYKEEEERLANSNTETFVKISATSNLEKWKNVELNFMTGKRLSKRLTEIEIHFRHNSIVKGIVGRNSLIFNIQPDEGITLNLQVKKPRFDEVEEVPMVFKYEDNFRGLLPNAYESLIFDIIRKKKANFISTEELEASWQFVDPITNHWRNGGNPIREYASGSDELL